MPILKKDIPTLHTSIRIIFWLVFFSCFFYFLIPKFSYFSEGIPAYMGKTAFMDRFWFVLHICAGVVVYITGLFQFIPALRNKHISTHRKLGKVFIAASLLCILTLYFIIPVNLCTGCRISQYMDTSLWLIFVSLAFYCIRKRQINLHQRFMVSSFICASYFVTVRLVDRFAMSFFNRITHTEDDAFLYSDIAAWLVPLALAWSFWGIRDLLRKKQSL